LSEEKDYFRGYIKGYEEALHEAWNDIIGLTSKGYSSKEIQVLAKSKRQSLNLVIRNKKKEIQSDTGIDLFEHPATPNPLVSNVQPGRTYFIEGRGLERAVVIFNGLTERGAKGLCISRRYPGEIRGRFTNEPAIYWLTKQEGGSQLEGGPSPEECISPSDMGKITTVVRSFMKGGKGSVVLLEGVEYLIWQNDFNAVLRFVQGLMDQTITTKTILLVSINPEAMEDHDIKVMECTIESGL
jgi:hypothetical protein